MYHCLENVITNFQQMEHLGICTIDDFDTISACKIPKHQDTENRSDMRPKQIFLLICWLDSTFELFLFFKYWFISDVCSM